MESWREHPYVDIVDNRKSRDFDGKVCNDVVRRIKQGIHIVTLKT